MIEDMKKAREIHAEDCRCDGCCIIALLRESIEEQAEEIRAKDELLAAYEATRWPKKKDTIAEV